MDQGPNGIEWSAFASLAGQARAIANRSRRTRRRDRPLAEMLRTPEGCPHYQRLLKTVESRNPVHLVQEAGVVLIRAVELRIVGASSHSSAV